MRVINGITYFIYALQRLLTNLKKEVYYSDKWNKLYWNN